MQVPLIDPKHFIGAVELNHLGLVECQGADACHFLHQQLTQELLSLPEGSSTKAGFCNAKGRLQASMVVVKVSNELVYLVLRKDLLERTLKRLSMFVLRAKVKLKDVSSSFSLVGVVGDPTSEQTLANAQCTANASLQPCLGWSRTLLALPKSNPQEALDLPFAKGPLTQEGWRVTEILSAEAWVEERTFEHFVPQMLNFESTGAVSFKKGCYPGQEVVARSQFRGTLKRRTVMVFSHEPLEVGMEVFSALHATESCAEILQVARHGELYLALACFQIDTLMKAIALSDSPSSLNTPNEPNAPIEAPDFNAFIQRQAFWSTCFSKAASSDQMMNLGFLPLPYRLLDDI